MLRELRKQLHELANPSIAQHSQRFFKTGAGEYGEGDKFIGVRVPRLRQLARKFSSLPLAKVERLLQSPIHEERLLALLLLVLQYQKGDATTQESIFDAYCRNIAFINNWDLVDSSAHWIVGPQLENGSKRQLHIWAKSSNLWERRISIISTLAYIKKTDFEATLAIAQSLRNDKEDLIHKAVGWMLREIGNRDRSVEEAFLRAYYHDMPRTMLRYAIEKFPEPLRKRYLSGSI